MRSIASLVTLALLAACDPGPAAEPDPDLEDPAASHAMVIPAEHTAEHAVTLYAEFADGLASYQTDLDIGLADDYPRQLKISADRAYVLAQDCQLEPGAVVWREVAAVDGTAASVSLVDGALAIDLHAEGHVTVVLDGEITDQNCTTPAHHSPTLTTVPLRHRIDLHVHRVAGYVVEQFHQQLADCQDTMILPSDAPLYIPTTRPLDAAGDPFTPINAPTPATITLRSPAALTPAAARMLTAEPGEVTITVDTTLPVLGLESFTVVGPDALTSVEAALYLQKAASKGTVSEPIAEGMAHRVFFPEQRNTVDLHVESAATAAGKLCANIPPTWFTTTSSTPAACTAGAEILDDFPSSTIPIATLHALGECRLEVTLPGTPHTWTTRFTTTL